eukprot:gnl/Spiro4/4607_TR2302_c0_g1_i1.p1 gnl/Spiro4/4607_TR2302_c0_g1~~gnl/Spiro4/4607_TR2302_c0_g1_i1.p1  ORF type:complete len:495 (+),score=138.03 gnl/Spiro4/4607_TR2302_c0_g1_i1:45-1529(+)
MSREYSPDSVTGKKRSSRRPHTSYQSETTHGPAGEKRVSEIVAGLSQFEMDAARKMERVQRQELEKANSELAKLDQRLRRVNEDLRSRNGRIQELYDEMEKTPVGKIIRHCRDGENEIKRLREQRQQLSYVVDDIRKSHERVRSRNPEAYLKEKEDELKALQLRIAQVHQTLEDMSTEKDDQLRNYRMQVQNEKQINIHNINRVRHMEADIHNIKIATQKNHSHHPVVASKEHDLDEIRNRIREYEISMGSDILKSQKRYEVMASLKSDATVYKRKYEHLKLANKLLMKKITLYEEDYASEGSVDEYKDDGQVIYETICARIHELREVFLDPSLSWKAPKYQAAYDFNIFQQNQQPQLPPQPQSNSGKPAPGTTTVSSTSAATAASTKAATSVAATTATTAAATKAATATATAASTKAATATAAATKAATATAAATKAATTTAAATKATTAATTKATTATSTTAASKSTPASTKAATGSTNPAAATSPSGGKKK